MTDLFSGVVITPTLDRDQGMLHLTLDCRDYNRGWHRYKAGVDRNAELIEPGAAGVLQDAAAYPFGDGSGLFDGSVFRYLVDWYWPGGDSLPSFGQIETTNPDWQAGHDNLDWRVTPTDLGAMLDQFISHQAPYARYHYAPDRTVWYRGLAPIGELPPTPVMAPKRICSDLADVDADTIHVDRITPSWDQDRARRRVFVQAKTEEACQWVDSPYPGIPIDAGEETILADGAINSEQSLAIGLWFLANKYRPFLGATASGIRGVHNWRVGQSLYAKDRELMRYLNGFELDFLPTIITQVDGKLVSSAAGITVTINGTDYTAIYKVDNASLSWSEVGFGQVGSARVELWLWDPAETIDVGINAPVRISTDGTADIEYALRFGDVEPTSLPAQFAQVVTLVPPSGPLYHFETHHEDPQLLPGTSEKVTWQLSLADHSAVPGAGIQGTLFDQVWATEAALPGDESDEYSCVLYSDTTNPLGQIYGVVTRISAPTKPAVKWDFDLIGPA